MKIKINNHVNTNLNRHTVWLKTPVPPDQTGEGNNRGSTQTISVKITSAERTKEEIEKAMENVITKNKELYRRLAE